MVDNVTYEFGPFRFDAAGVLSREDETIPLRPQEASVLLVLLENAGHVVTMKVFRDRVWPHIARDVKFDNTLRHAIYRLRKVFGEEENSCQYIKTESKRGYCFKEKVKVGSNRQPLSGKGNLELADESQVLAERYERRLDDIFVLLREVCQDISRGIEVKLAPREQAHPDYVARVKPEADTSYKRGRYLWSKRTPKTLQQATVLLEKAIEVDSKFALAQSALADCHAVMASQSWPPREACDKAKLAASRALSLDSTLAEPHAALGFVLSVFEHQWEKAEQEFQEAIRLNANCSTAHHWFSFHLAALNRLQEAIKQVEKAQEIEPASPMINTNVGTMLYWARKYDAAIEQYDQVLSVEPDFWYAYWMRGLAYDEKKQHREAAADQQRAIEHFPGDSPLLAASLARSLALSGDPGDHAAARRELEKLKQAARNSAPPHYHIGMVHAALEETATAFRCLFESCKAHEMWVSFIQVDPKMDALRSHPRYGDLVRELLF